MIRIVLMILLSFVIGQTAATEIKTETASARLLDFKVFLNDREVGQHRFELREQDESIEVSSAMSLDFKILRIKRIKYRHQANEIWQSGCLVSLLSETEKQGKASVVKANTDQSGLVVQRASETETLSGCVRGFSYWNPQWLEGDHLLNAETGINVPVQISSRMTESDSIKHIKITLPKTDINLQYDAAGEWLALQTELLIGGTLRYQRVF